ncbi:MAG: NAD(P)/FAD-dependent oxidoreductase [Chloroflexota bacterium]|nr:NAD(P)/FAD-dependent oxidoreductase [Chloroflexota bacterium]
MTGAYDAIVVGAGHNGLVCAAYLARAGLRVIVLERRLSPGGMAVTSQLQPGVRVPTLAHTVGRLWPRIVRELNLAAHRLVLAQPDVRVFAPQLDGPPLTLWGDAERTRRELASGGSVTAQDAAGYVAVERSLNSLGAALAALMAHPPPELASPTLTDAFDGLRHGILGRSRARSESGGLLRVLPMAVADLAAEWFGSEPLRAVVAARGIQYTAMGPLMPGTAQVLLSDVAGNAGGVAGQTVFAHGAPGALAEALTAAVGSFGGVVKTGAEVVAVRRHGDRVAGVTVADGDELDAPVVVSALDPRKTLLDLLEPEVLGPRLSWRAGNIGSNGATAKVNLALADLPRFAGLDADEADVRLRGRIVFAPSIAALVAATTPAKYGRLPDAPYMEATIPTLVDPRLIDAPQTGRRRRHVMSVIVQAMPYALRDGDWIARADELGDLVLASLERYAPGISGLTEARQVITPLDIERDFGATGGHPMHAEIGLDQWFAWRPLHGYGRYRMPLAGLYLCAAGAHPGGGITGGPGLLASREILADRRSGAW